MRGPVSKTAATWIAGLTSAPLAILGAIIREAVRQPSDRHSGINLIPWIFVFLLARWIMTRRGRAPRQLNPLGMDNVRETRAGVNEDPRSLG
jgi:hypothetical protein